MTETKFALCLVGAAFAFVFGLGGYFTYTDHKEGEGAREAATHWLRDVNVDVIDLKCGGEEKGPDSHTICWVIYRDAVAAIHKQTLVCSYRVCRPL